VGWVALDAVAPTDSERRAVIGARLDQLATEGDSIDAERTVRRAQLRADSIAGVSTHGADERTLADLAAQATVNADEQLRLSRLLDGEPVVDHPHAHLSHRAVPLPTEPKERRRLLRIWATISTPLLFALIAVMVGSEGFSILGSALVAFLLVLGIEALSRRRLGSYLVRVALLFVVFTLAGVIVVAFIASWQVTAVVLLASLAFVFLFLNLRELRRN
jgi:hypothetical protein